MLLPVLASLLPQAPVAGAGVERDASALPLVSERLQVDGSRIAGTLQPLWLDHYDLSYTHLGYAAEPGFLGLVADLAPRSIRCSVGRWEVGTPPPAGGDSLDPAVLRAVEREFYRGANTLAAADDPASYEFGYLDAQLASLVAIGAAPFLCFDYMPFTLSSEQAPGNPNNFNLTQPGTPYANHSFSNGIRTAPPADPLVYARVVRNTMLHVRGLFAGTLDYGVTHFEVGNEPDLITPLLTPLPLFWTGDVDAWAAMYAAIAAEVEADPFLSGSVRLGGGSFAFQEHEPTPTFLQLALTRLAAQNARLDFVSYHSYSDDPLQHLLSGLRARSILATLGSGAELVNGEWGRALNGLDPVYGQIEHGLFRTRVLAYMELLGLRFAHEALLRDPLPLPDSLGLLRTGPAAHKPVSHCYRALRLLDDALAAVPVVAPAGTFLLAGRDLAGTRLVVVLVAAAPAAGTARRAALEVVALPWGQGRFRVRRWKVDTATATSGVGLALELDVRTTGGAYRGAARWGVGEEGLVVWELTRL